MKHLLGVIVLAVSLAGPATAAPVADKAKEVIANMRVAVGKLTSLAGELAITYSPGFTPVSHRITFWFAKPFKFKFVNHSTGTEVYYASFKGTVYQPDHKQATELDLTMGYPELFQAFFKLFEINGFLEGAVLGDVEEQFFVHVEEEKAHYRMTLRPKMLGIYQLALQLSKIVVLLDRKQLFPTQIEIFRPDLSSRLEALYCKIAMKGIRYNEALSDQTFVFKAPADIQRQSSTDILKEWVDDQVGDSGKKAKGWLDSLWLKVKRYREHPWDY